jgi:hypothetical protein
MPSTLIAVILKKKPFKKEMSAYRLMYFNKVEISCQDIIFNANTFLLNTLIIAQIYCIVDGMKHYITQDFVYDAVGIGLTLWALSMMMGVTYGIH